MKFRWIMLGVFLSVVLLTFAGCGISLMPQTTAKWSFLVYMDGDNSLESDAIKDFNEMERVGSTKDVNILVLFDRTPGYDNSNGDWKGTRLYKVTKDDDPNVIHSELLTASPWGKKDDSIEADMSNPNTLRDFIECCQKHYPAQHTVLTLWDHGGGVYPKSLKPSLVKRNMKTDPFRMKPGGVVASKGICWDDTTGDSAWDCLTTDQVASALAAARAQSGQKVDLVNMDACLMQMIEVAYEWKNETDYLVGSEESVPGDGNNYATLLTKLTGNPDMTVETFATTLVDDYYATYKDSGWDTTYSALKLGAPLNTFVSDFAALATKLKDTTDRSGVYQAWQQTAYFDYVEITDLYDFTLKLTQLSTDTQVKSAAANLQNDFNGLVISHHETGAHMSTGTLPAYGLAVLMPNWEQWNYYAGSDQYVSLNLSKDTDWDEFVLGFVDYTSVLANWNVTPAVGSSYNITFVGDGTFTSDVDSGTWSLNGNQITWDKNGTTFTGTVNFSHGTMSGSMTGAATGDWTAVRQ